MIRRGLLPAAALLAPATALAQGNFGTPLRLKDVVPEETPLELERLRVCADPNNLPFSNEAEEGFENRIAEIVAEELGVPLEYHWRPQRRGFIREGLNADKCDLVMGTITGFDMASTTKPYYRSSYVFLQRAGDERVVDDLDDPDLREMTVGVHLIGDDYANTPGAHALGKRGITDNVVGFSIYGDYSEPNPPADLVKAVGDETIDLAIVWGPFAGYFGDRLETPTEIRFVKPAFDPPDQPFVYSISMAVKYGNYPLRKPLNEIINKRQTDIDRILAEYGVPRVDTPTTGG